MPTNISTVVAAAAALSVAAVTLGMTYINQRTIKAELRQNGAKLDKIDPWTIYTAVAADFLTDQER